MIDIVGHSVNIKDIGLIQFMYPNYQIIDKPVLFTDRPIIYTGETRYLNRIKELGVDYIVISPLAEFNLEYRNVLLNVVFNHHKKSPYKYILDYLDELDNSTFIELIKYYWITGVWPMKEYTKSGVFLDLIYSFNTDTYTILKKYIELLDKADAEYIETSLLTFLNRVLLPSGKLSPKYKEILLNYKNTKRKSYRESNRQLYKF